MDHEAPLDETSAPRWQRAVSSLWLLGLLPLLVLGLLLWVFLFYGPVGVFRAALPPLEELTIERVELRTPAQIKVHITNTGPQPVTVAQVLIDDAYQLYMISPGHKLHRFGRAQITVPYPWVEGEPLEVTVLTSTGATFSREVEVASETPVVSGRYLTAFTLLGVYAGLIPVFVGLLWLPFIRRLERHWLNFFLALTAGLLLFLGVDTIVEALTLATREVAEAFQGVSLVLVGALGAFLGLTLIMPRKFQTVGTDWNKRLWVAYLIALGIGLHNLGEGLAIGTAYAIGNIALGSLLVVGFMVHNTTEGLAIVAPVGQGRIKLYHLALMGILAGGPTIVGTWIGGFISIPALSTLFLAIGAGAIFMVLYQLGRLVFQESRGGDKAYLASGFLAGLLLMYLTGLLVVA